VKKSDVLNVLYGMPEELDVESLIYTLWFRHKLELAEADVDAGNLIPHEDVKKVIKGWLASSGHPGR
jgi:hypothetical protein